MCVLHSGHHMSPDARLPGTPLRFDNRALLRAVHRISFDLTRRTSASVRDATFSSLLSDIWGQSQYATIEILAQKRRQSDENLARKRRDHASPSSSGDHDSTVSTLVKRRSSKDRRLNQISSAQRDKLIRILRTTHYDESFDRERALTIDLLRNPAACDIDALRRLWDVPRVIFDVTRLGRYFAEHGRDSVLEFFDSHIWRKSRDSRVFNILYWKECCLEKARYEQPASKHPVDCSSQPIHERLNNNRQLRTVSKLLVAKVIKTLLLRRRSPFFERNLDIVVETVLFAIHPDRFVDRFRESTLRDTGFFKALHTFEYSRSFTGAMENLQIGKLNRMLKDIRAIRSIEVSHGFHTTRQPTNTSLSLRAIRRYCAEQDSLTDRVLRRIYDRHARDQERRCGSHADDLFLSLADFVRMYLAWVACWTDVGLRYWFLVLDQDGDGTVGVGDIAHFYSERKIESERSNGIMLVDVRWLWFRLCAMCGASPNCNGLDMNAFKEMAREEREFVMYALLARRADDGTLTNVAATLALQMDASAQIGM